MGTKEMDQWFRVQAALAGGLSLAPSTHKVVHNHL